MSKSTLKKGILQLLIANVLNMIFSIGTNFLLPKYLSVESYSQIKTYQLYITYVAVLHFGYNDGMYLKFGGRSINEVYNEEIQKNISTLKLFQFIMTICSVCVAFGLHDTALLMAAIAILPQNMIAYFKNFYQAIGEFKKYSRIMNMTTGLTFAINLFLIAVIRTDRYQVYLVGYIILSVILWFVLEYSLQRIKEFKPFAFDFSLRELYENVASGILLLLGNFSSQLLTGMNRWFVKGLMDTLAFAQYSFAVSMENFLNVAVTPISVTMYNYFCNHDENKDIIRIRELVIAFATVIVATAFPVKFILEIFLQKYLDSVTVIFLLFAAQIFYIIIKSIYVNLYKARKMQKKYFTKLCIIVIVGFAFNVICYAIYHVKESFALGSLLSAIVWFFLCLIDFKELRYSPRHYVYIFIETIVFLACGILLESIMGGILYITITIILSMLLLPDAMKKIWNTGKVMIIRMRKSKSR
ncbi:hypothetical protein [Lacrimispora sp.]|uniref:hypothetical protein n=1 Tax=Lacrimispora sp. TaxID=2719234 RepID=UPI0028599979|nr:hypothetical protein [Lacrimispora sp.]MDR7813046.1 hypothetical protein [Lacrimispora sp.]